MKRLATTLFLLALAAAPAAASVVEIDMTVNGGTTPVTVAPGDTITVQLSCLVTDNLSSGIALGLAGYGTDILTTGAYLQPVLASDGFGGFTNNWDATFDSLFGATAPGNPVGPGQLYDVMGNGATVGIITTSNRTIGVASTVLVTGDFTAIAPGISDVSIDMADGTLVITHDSGGYHSVAPTSLVVLPTSAVQVTVTPEPASVALLGLGALGLLRRSRRNRGHRG